MSSVLTIQRQIVVLTLRRAELVNALAGIRNADFPSEVTLKIEESLRDGIAEVEAELLPKIDNLIDFDRDRGTRLKTGEIGETGEWDR